MSIKKVVMYVDMNDEEVLRDDYYKESFDWCVKNGMSKDEVKSNTAGDALESIMRDVFCDERFVNEYEYNVYDINEEDKGDYEYKELVEKIKRNTIPYYYAIEFKNGESVAVKMYEELTQDNISRVIDNILCPDASEVKMVRELDYEESAIEIFLD